MAQSLRDILVDFLKNRPGEKFTAREIARHAIEEYPEWFAFVKQRAKRNMSDDQWQGDIAGKVNTKILHTAGFSTKYPQIKSIGKRPRLFYWDEGVVTSIPVEVPQGPTLSQAQGLRDIVVNFLKSHPDQKFTANEIAQWVINNHPEWFESRKSRSTEMNTPSGWVQRIGGEVTTRLYHGNLSAKHPQIKHTDERPRRFYWESSAVNASPEAAHQASHQISASPSMSTPRPSPSRLSEHDLYPLLTGYLASIGVYSLRIDERRSVNKQGPKGNKWLYPDLVGMEDLTEDWCDQTKNIANVMGGMKAKLWSFEVKLSLSRSDVREFFFQTISNSSWAHLSYLVAADIDHASGSPVMKELRMLSASHGIGVIELNVNDPKESQILIPARERDQVDWDTCNRLTEENKDFQRYIRYVHEFYRVEYVNPANWDKPPEDDEDDIVYLDP